MSPAVNSSRRQKKPAAPKRTSGRPSTYGSEVDELDSSMDEKEDYYSVKDEEVEESAAKSTPLSTVKPKAQTTVNPTAQSSAQSSAQSHVKSTRPSAVTQAVIAPMSSSSRQDMPPSHAGATHPQVERHTAQAATEIHALTLLVNQLLDGQRLQAERIAALETPATPNGQPSSTTAVTLPVATAVTPAVATATSDIWVKHWQVHEEHRQAALEGKLGLEYHQHFLPFRVVSAILSGRYQNPNEHKAMAGREQLSHEMRVVQHLVIHFPGPAAFGIAWQTCISLMVHGLGPSQAIKGIELTNAMNDYSAFLMDKAMSCSWESVMLFHVQYCAPRFGSLSGASDPAMWPVPVDDRGAAYSKLEEETWDQFQGARVPPPAASAPNNSLRMLAAPIEPQPRPPAATTSPGKNRARSTTVSNVPQPSDLANGSTRAKIRAESTWKPTATGANAQAVATRSRDAHQPAPLSTTPPQTAAPAPAASARVAAPPPPAAGAPPPQAAKRKRADQETETVANDRPCYNWNHRTCSDPCPAGKVHSCRLCITGDHRHKDCPTRKSKKPNPPEYQYKGKPCFNWNFESCDTPCVNGRDHVCRLCKSLFHSARWCKDSHHYKRPPVDEDAIPWDSLS